MTALDPTVYARSTDALIEASTRTERAALRAERCAQEWLTIARRLIRDVDADLARRALQLRRAPGRSGC